MKHEHVAIAVLGVTTPAVERVPARRVADNKWLLNQSPLYAMGVAAGDVIKVLSPETGTFDVVARGGNVCVQFYLDESKADDLEVTSKLADSIQAEIGPLGGCVGACTPGLISFTVPVDIGFPSIERVCELAIERAPGSQWQYANVYHPRTGELLDWWKEQPCSQQ